MECRQAHLCLARSPLSRKLGQSKDPELPSAHHKSRAASPYSLLGRASLSSCPNSFRTEAWSLSGPLRALLSELYEGETNPFLPTPPRKCAFPHLNHPNSLKVGTGKNLQTRVKFRYLSPAQKVEAALLMLL